ncbi:MULTISPECIES: CheR family methyltransferase [unclassified Flavobacterium]|uniref:CheR family methyltransferase n=1 Tax=unclassified Flavobacterium TaxID=196869 RepID=UPI003F8EC237
MVQKKASVGQNLEKNKLSNTNKEKFTSKDTFHIVGMGASAGGLEALKDFFSAASKDMGMAFVIVQHLDPTHKSLMVQLLKSHTEMPVSEVEDLTKVEPNHVYVIPPNKDMAIFKGILHLIEPVQARGFRKPIDFFFKTLAADQTERAIGIILSGTGTEGAAGLKEIKDMGGLSIVQDPENAKYDGMPRNAIAAGADDFVLTVRKMPEALLKYATNRTFKSGSKTDLDSNLNQLLSKIFILLRNETGCNFGDYKNSTVIRRIEKRMALNQIEKLEDYLKYVQKNKEELKKLFNELLIGVTSFFRDKDAYTAVEETIVGQIIANKTEGDTIRIWVAGCSTGEEAYSLAILFDEAIKKQEKSLKLQIFASDMDNRAITIARQGLYPETIFSDVTPERLKKYFQHEDATYRINKEIRDKVIFSEHNLIKDPPFSKLDMVSCRNLLIYLNIEAQKKVFAIFHYALNPDGVLFLGSSESLGDYANMFEVINRKHKLFKHKLVKKGEVPDIGHLFTEPSSSKKLSSFPMPKRDKMDNLANITEQLLLDNYAPACAIINESGDAIYFTGNTGKYLQPSPGEARLNIVDMAREGLKTDLRSIISKIRKSNTKEIRTNISVKTNGHQQLIDLSIIPMKHLLPQEDYFMLTFVDRGDTSSNSVTDIETIQLNDVSEMQALEQELIATKEYLRFTIEQLEISNEELKASNEELQSSNEELQSTNEELETSKEELQSVNEEIITVNTELQNKIDELALAYDDMNNLLASTEIGTIFLDIDLKIKRFTPSISKIFNLIQTDVGRPLQHLTSNLVSNNIIEDAKKVLEKLSPFQSAVRSTDEKWYQMQIMPYRTSSNVIEGVVITFVDITKEKSLALELHDIKENYEYLLELTLTSVYTQDLKLIYTSLFSKDANFNSNLILGKTDSGLFNEEDAIKLEAIKKKVIKTKKPYRDSIFLYTNGLSRFYDITVRPIIADSKVLGIAGTFTDLTELNPTEKQTEVTNEKINES